MARSDSPRAHGNGVKAPLPQSGTRLAIYTISKSAGPFDGKPRSLGWGGARNRADRVSDGLTAKQVTALWRAVGRATDIGLPLNRHWTIHWGRLGLLDSEACTATGALLTLVRDWLRKQGLPFAYVWVRENDAGDPDKGSHVHILLHLSEYVVWSGWRTRRWIERATGRAYRTGASCTKVIGRSRKTAYAATEAFLVNLGAVAAYVAKGASIDAVEALGRDWSQPGGRIIGKRWGRSQNLRSGLANTHGVKNMIPMLTRSGR